jgi:undecaprenyl-diphosphatase
MDLFSAIVLGMIQGITEWLPVSSKAMVSLAGKMFFGLSYQDALATAVWLHTGTLLAAIIYFRKDIIALCRSVLDKKSDKSEAIFIIVATIMTGIIGLPLFIIALNVSIPDWTFTLIMGLLLLCMGILQINRKSAANAAPNVKNALIVGLAQGLAAIPGISRSGSSLAALLGEGFPLDAAFRMSFLMSIPAVLGIEVVLPFIKGGFLVSPELIAGSAAAGLVGFFTMGMMLDIAKRKDFYKVTLALGVLITALAAGIYLGG